MISQGPSVCVFNKENPQEVLASWLFTEYLLSNEVQTAYAETEGYVPVTAKAQQSPEYQDYLSRSGENNDLYYDIKIDATKLLMENTRNTFVTPVFNGSASVRDAAGQLIEEAVKGVRRKKDVDGEFVDQLFTEMVSLKHLDQIETGSSSGKKDLGPLPGTAVTLLSCLAVAWVLIGIYALFLFLRKKK
jgi:multiple sugar transport system substrate-binding protein